MIDLPSPSILILSRGARMGPTLGAMSAHLTKSSKVVVSLGLFSVGDYEEDLRWFPERENQHTFSLEGEVQKRLKDVDDLLSKAQEIEKEIGVTAYAAAGNYTLYRRQSNEMGGWTWHDFMSSEESYLQEFVGAYLVYKDIIDKHDIKIVFCESPDTVAAMVCLALCRQKGIFLFGMHISPIYGDGKAFFYHGANRRNPVMEFYLNNPDQLTQDQLEQGKNLVERLERGNMHDAVYLQKEREKIKSDRRLITWRRIKSFFTPNKLKNVGTHVRHVMNRKWYSDRCIAEPPEGDFILFLLQRQPEASTCLNAPKWVDQDKIIEQLSINAPAGMKICVKENPRSFGLRGKEYYGQMMDLYNVRLVQPFVQNTDFIEKCRAIITITGTVGMEGSLTGKPVGVLGEPYYSCFSGLKTLTAPEEIYGYLSDPNWKPAEMVVERHRLASAYMASLFELGNPVNGTARPLPEEGGRNLAVALQNFLNFSHENGIDSKQLNAGVQFDVTTKPPLFA